MIDYSHIDSHIVHQSDEYEFHAHAPSLSIENVFLEIPTLLGNEQNFVYVSRYINDDDCLVAKYQQANSPYVLFLYYDNE